MLVTKPFAIPRRQLLMAGLALPVWACSPSPGAPLVLSLHPWPGYEFVYLAQVQGLLSTHRVQLREVAAATASLQALEAGTADAACLTLDEAIGARARGVDVAVVAVLDFSAGGDALVASPSVRSLSDLRGKTVGVEQTAVGAIMLDAVLAAGGLQPQDVRVVYMAPHEHEAALGARRADAMITYEPFKSRLLQAGARELYSSARIPERIVDVLVVRRAAMERQADTIRLLVAAHFEALALWQKNPAQFADLMAARLGLTPAQVDASFAQLRMADVARNRQLLAGSQPALAATVQRLTDIMWAAGLLTQPPALAGLLEPRFLP